MEEEEKNRKQNEEQKKETRSVPPTLDHLETASDPQGVMFRVGPEYNPCGS